MVDKSLDLKDSHIDELMADWFERDGETFVKISSHKRVGWESTLSKEAAYSEYLLEAPTRLDLLKRAYPMAKDMITVMNPPFKVNVKISKGSDSFTGGKTITVSSKMFDDVDLSVGEQLDVFMGLTVHEGAHVIYTDFEVLRMEGFANQAIKALFNIIEDERIEQKVGEEKPGLARFLEKTRYYYFDLLYMGTVSKEIKNDFDRLFDIFLKIMRYPKYLVEEDIVFFGHHLLEIKNIVQKIPVDTVEALNQAVEVFEVFKEFYLEKAKEEKAKKEAEEKLRDLLSEMSEEGDGGGDSEEDSTGGKPKKEVGEDEDSEDTSTSEGSPTSEEAEEESRDSPSKELTEEEIKEVISKLEEDSFETADRFTRAFTKSPSERLASGDVSDALDEVSAKVVEGTLSVGTSKDAFFTMAKEEARLYMDARSKIQRYVPAISKVLKGHCREYKLIHKSMRSGVLDTTKLAEAFQGVPSVYIREGEVKTDRVTVCVLIDESGSMGGSRIQAARETAILINEAVGSIPQVELFIYGHTGDMLYSGATEMTVYREAGFNKRYALGSVAAHSENRDGVAIFETAKRVRRFTKNPVLMFVLSDGAPAARDYGGYSAMTHVKENVNKVEKMGFSVVQVCINHSYDPAKMFNHFVVLDNMANLAKDLGIVIKKATIKAAKVHVT